MRAWTAFESWAAAPLLTRTVAVGLACAYIDDAGMQVWVRILMIEEDLRGLEFEEMLWYSVKEGTREPDI